jgi:excinuclease ABC subunit A
MVIAAGTPEEVAAEAASHTGQFLAELLTPTPPKRASGAKSGKGASRKRRAKVPA